MKKLLTLIVTITAAVVGGYFLYAKFGHQPVHGLVIVDPQQERLNTTLKTQQQEIATKLILTAKYQKSTDTLVISAQQAQQLVARKGLKKVTKKGKDDYRFKALTQAPATLPVIYSKNGSTDKLIDQQGVIYRAKVRDYVVLGQTSAFTKNILILTNSDFQQFHGTKTQVAVLTLKDDAAKKISSFDGESLQIFDQDL
ncbi:lipoprotein BA_5634 family protein [Lapidilactobacillus luobeiensis]|uniref:lipoprotein BA_5634 family protein n=1 Tax=Lapidilactobacillus luobeiensis TaxID=2950371 RepID=UPI0021C2F0C1|nr:lipoprotein BA_5634 family protein [Lapidilactobacillus luobeiensis]